MKIDKITLYTSSRLSKKSTKTNPKFKHGYGLSVTRYTVPQFVWGTVYHWYDMRFPSKMPGWHKFEDWLSRHGAERRIALADPEPRWRDRLLAWTVNQDLRCPFNTGQYGRHLAHVEIDEKTFWDLHKKIHRFEAEKWSEFMDRQYQKKKL